MNISRLIQVPLREVWKHEEYNFSAWMAMPENLELLSDEIGISLANPVTETLVGSFSADIIAEDESTGDRVLIENQLEASNHDHLGKLFTYGAGLDAGVIIWIVKNAREEHEQAINWINEHTDDRVNFFLIQIEAWRIGDSDAAPRFNIIAKPNDWAKTVRSSPQMNNSRVVSDYNLLQQRFWENLKEFDSAGVTGSRKVRPQHWYDISIGKTNGHISLTVNKNDQRITCDLYVPHDEDKAIYDELFKHKEAIEKQLEGYPIEWMRLDNKSASRLRTSFSANIADESLWPDYYNWLVTMTIKLKKVFPKYLKQK